MMGLLPLLLAAILFMFANCRENETAGFYLFGFGDSYTSNGFNISGRQPSVAYPLGNPDIGSHTSANGPVWFEYLTTSFNTTITLGYDFGISGVSIPDGFTQEILFEFEPQYSSQYGKTWNGDNSIFASWIGINDINWQSLLFSGNGSDYNATFPPRMDRYFSLMDNLYNTGARRFFFINMPPLNRAPMVTSHSQEIIDNYAEGVALFNDVLLPGYVDRFSSNHSGVKTAIYNAHALFTAVLDEPHMYGYKDDSCFSQTGCFWANNYHPVSSMHERLAHDMLGNLTSIGWPPLVLPPS
ncbi:MAG: hypothetical protein MMC23_007902 [Stictis urceolatum]|nr:hypothetical protein [Stictis urceolata]